MIKQSCVILLLLAGFFSAHVIPTAHATTLTGSTVLSVTVNRTPVASPPEGTTTSFGPSGSRGGSLRGISIFLKIIQSQFSEFMRPAAAILHRAAPALPLHPAAPSATIPAMVPLPLPAYFIPDIHTGMNANPLGVPTNSVKIIVPGDYSQDLDAAGYTQPTAVPLHAAPADNMGVNPRSTHNNQDANAPSLFPIFLLPALHDIIPQSALGLLGKALLVLPAPKKAVTNIAQSRLLFPDAGYGLRVVNDTGTVPTDQLSTHGAAVQNPPLPHNIALTYFFSVPSAHTQPLEMLSWVLMFALLLFACHYLLYHLQQHWLCARHASCPLPQSRIHRHGILVDAMVLGRTILISIIILLIAYFLFLLKEGSYAQTGADVSVSLDVQAGDLLFGCSSPQSLGTIQDTGDTGAYDDARAVTCTVSTTDVNGYSMRWQVRTGSGGTATGSMISEHGLSTIAPYSPAVPGTPELWTVTATGSEWGGRLSSNSSFADTSLWGVDGVNEKWLNVATGTTVIALRPTQTSGTDTELVGFRAEVGAQKSQAAGLYKVTIIFTAITN